MFANAPFAPESELSQPFKYYEVSVVHGTSRY